MQHNAHVYAHCDYLMDQIMAALGMDAVSLGWADWFNYAAQGEW